MPGQTIFKKERIWIAIIPVVGSIIIAIITTNHFSCNRESDNKSKVNNLRSLAGKINDLVIYDDYNEIYPMFSAGLKPKLTKNVWEAANDTMQKLLGNYIKPIDTSEMVFLGVTTYYIRNQRQFGQSITSVTFDDQGKIFGIYVEQVIK